MEKDLMLTANDSLIKRVADTVQGALSLLSTPLRLLRGYYSTVLEREVSQRQANAITSAQLAFFTLMFPADYPLLLRVAALVLTLAAVRKVKREMAHDE